MELSRAAILTWSSTLEIKSTGAMLGDIRGHRIAEHGGFAGTHMLRILDDELTIIVLTNLDLASGNRPAELARGIAGLFKPEYQSPHQLVPQPDPAPRTTQDIRALLADMALGKGSSIMTSSYLAFYNGLPEQLLKNLAQ
jgi:hypothetical protein